MIATPPSVSKQKLIAMGKQKGFVTYDEVNDAMPDDIVSSDQIDDWLSALGDEGIEVVDGGGAGGGVKVPTARAAPKVPEVIEEERKRPPPRAKRKRPRRKSEEDYEGYSKTNDPVRMYLRKMGWSRCSRARARSRLPSASRTASTRCSQVVLN